MFALCCVPITESMAVYTCLCYMIQVYILMVGGSQVCEYRHATLEPNDGRALVTPGNCQHGAVMGPIHMLGVLQADHSNQTVQLHSTYSPAGRAESCIIQEQPPGVSNLTSCRSDIHLWA